MNGVFESLMKVVSRCRLEVIVQLHEAAGERRCCLPLRQWKQVTLLTPSLAAAMTAWLCNTSLSNRPSHILLNCGVPEEVATNALRLSVGRATTQADVDAVVEDLRGTVELLEESN